MSEAGECAYEPLTNEHLGRLVRVARSDRDDLFRRRPHLAVLADRVVSVALCQGGALHYVDGRNGVKDLDVWTLYAGLDGFSYPWRRRGRTTGCEMPGLEGWTGRVDLLGRSLPVDMSIDPAAAWRTYLQPPRSRSAWHLSRKPVVLLEPADRRGEVVWNPTEEAGQEADLT